MYFPLDHLFAVNHSVEGPWGGANYKAKHKQPKNPTLRCHHWIFSIWVGFFIIVVRHSLNGIFLKKVVRRSNIFDRSKLELRYLAHSPSWEEEKAPFLLILRINHYTALAIPDSTTVKLQSSNNLWPSHGILNNSYHCFSQRKKKGLEILSLPLVPVKSW